MPNGGERFVFQLNVANIQKTYKHRHGIDFVYHDSVYYINSKRQ